jgi:hypothetical protein
MNDLLSFSWQVADGMVVTECLFYTVSNTQAYLASKSCVHRDVATRNVMINERKMAKVIKISLKQTHCKDRRLRLVSRVGYNVVHISRWKTAIQMDGH